MTYFGRGATLFAIFMVPSICYRSSFLVDGILESGKPLILTPYISSGRIVEARVLSLVNLPDSSTIISYSGFITVNKTFNSNMFFWFVPATESCFINAPLLLWLQGGPGATGLIGFFSLNGPYFLYANRTTGLRKYAWTKRFNVIYVDNPVGTGFSFTDSNDGYSRTQDDVAGNLYEFLQQFFIMFPEYLQRDFYVTGESYAGKYIPALSYKIHQEGGKSGIPFKGMAIGNGLVDPETMMNYAPYIYQLGLIDLRQASVIKNATDKILQNIRSENYLQAYAEFDEIFELIGPLTNRSYMRNFTGFSYYYNYLFSESPEDVDYFMTYVVQPDVKKAIHVGDLPFNGLVEVQNNLFQDIMKSVKPQAKVIMENYRVMFYNGQLDLSVPYPATVNFLRSVDWKYAREYKEAERIIWRLKDSDYIAGYVHNVEDFYEVMVRNSGHLVPHDQPAVALDLITRFLCKKSFETEKRMRKLCGIC